MKELRYLIADKRTDRSLPNIIKRAELAIEEIKDIFPDVTFEIKEDTNTTMVYIRIQYDPNKTSDTNIFCIGLLFGRLT